jgi:hypothetical protein
VLTPDEDDLADGADQEVPVGTKFPEWWASEFIILRGLVGAFLEEFPGSALDWRRLTELSSIIKPCKMAKLSGSDTLDIKDIQLILAPGGLGTCASCCARYSPPVAFLKATTAPESPYGTPPRMEGVVPSHGRLP